MTASGVLLLFALTACLSIWLVNRDNKIKEREEAKKAADEERRAEQEASRERMERWIRAGPTREVLDEMRYFGAHIDWRTPDQIAADWERVERARKQEMEAWLATQAEERKSEFRLFGQRYHNPFNRD